MINFLVLRYVVVVFKFFLIATGAARAPKPQTPSGFHRVCPGMTAHRSPGLLGNLYEESLLTFRVQSGGFQGPLNAAAQVGGAGGAPCGNDAGTAFLRA